VQLVQRGARSDGDAAGTEQVSVNLKCLQQLDDIYPMAAWIGKLVSCASSGGDDGNWNPQAQGKWRGCDRDSFWTPALGFLMHDTEWFADFLYRADPHQNSDRPSFNYQGRSGNRPKRAQNTSMQFPTVIDPFSLRSYIPIQNMMMGKEKRPDLPARKATGPPPTGSSFNTGNPPAQDMEAYLMSCYPEPGSTDHGEGSLTLDDWQDLYNPMEFSEVS
jgi:hypothetical protein